MKIFKLVRSEIGAIESFHAEGIDTYTAEDTYNALLNSEEEYAGEGVQALAVAFDSLDLNFRRLAKARNGQILKIKVGNNTTLVDITSWNLDTDREGLGDMLEAMKDSKGKFPSKPTALVINGYKKALFADNESLKTAKASRIGFVEAIMSSSKIPPRNFRPAYGGGLISSPANKRKVYSDVSSFDISSSYPYSAISELLPTGDSQTIKGEESKPVPVKEQPKNKKDRVRASATRERSSVVRTRVTVSLDGEINLGRGIGFIGIFSFTGLKRNSWVKVPMIRDTDEDFCTEAIFDRLGLVSGNLRAAFCKPDLKAFAIQYTWKSVEVVALEAHNLAPLPKAARSYLVQAFNLKSEATDPIERLKAKTAINTVVGLWGIDPFATAEKDIKNGKGGYVQSYDNDLSGAWLKYAGKIGENGHTSGGQRLWDHRWATYTVAYARLRIVEAEKMLMEAGAEVLYCDTDSLKFVGPGREVFEKLNADILRKNAAIGIPSEMGVWADESKDFVNAVFRGKKFYVHQSPDGSLHPRIAGIYRHHSEAVFRRITLEELAFLKNVEIHTTRPDIGVLQDDPFGANFQEMAKPQVFNY